MAKASAVVRRAAAILADTPPPDGHAPHRSPSHTIAIAAASAAATGGADAASADAASAAVRAARALSAAAPLTLARVAPVVPAARCGAKLRQLYDEAVTSLVLKTPDPYATRHLGALRR